VAEKVVAISGTCRIIQSISSGIAKRLNIIKEDVMVSLTDSAVEKFKDVVSKQGTAGDGVRIFAVPGG
jgi:hypothetical protein